MGAFGSEWSWREVFSNPFLLLTKRPEKPVEGYNPLDQPPNDPLDAWRQYMAANLLDALEQVPDTGDWHGALRIWCEAHRGEATPNRQPSLAE